MDWNGHGARICSMGNQKAMETPGRNKGAHTGKAKQGEGVKPSPFLKITNKLKIERGIIQ